MLDDTSKSSSSLLQQRPRAEDLILSRSCCIFNGFILEVLIRSENQHYIPRQAKCLNESFYVCILIGERGKARKKKRLKSFPLTNSSAGRASALARNEDFIMNNGVE